MNLTRKLIFILTCVLCFSKIYAQKSRDKFIQYLNTGNQYLYVNLDSADLYSNKSLENAIESLEKIEAYRLRASVYMFQTRADSALKYATKAYSICMAIDQSDSSLLRRLNCLNLIAEVNKDFYDIENSKQQYDRILSELKKIKSIGSKLQAIIYNNKAEVLIQTDEYSQAKIYLDSALKLSAINLSYCKAIKDSLIVQRTTGYVYGNLGRYFEYVKNIDSAEYNYRKSIGIFQNIHGIGKVRNDFDLARINHMFGIFFQRQKKSSEKISYKDSSDSYSKFALKLDKSFLPYFYHDITKETIAYGLVQQKLSSARTRLSQVFIVLIIILLAGLIWITILVYKLRKSNRNLISKNELAIKMNELGLIIAQASSEKDLSGIINLIFNKINEIVDAPIVIIGLYNSETEKLEYYVREVAKDEMGRDKPEPYSTFLPRSSQDEKSILAKCFRSGKMELENNYSTEEYNKAIQGSDARSIIAYPLILKNFSEPIGVFSLQSFKPNAYRTEDQVIIGSISSRIALLISDFITKNELYSSLLDHSTRISVITNELMKIPLDSSSLIVRLQDGLLQKSDDVNKLIKNVHSGLDLLKRKSDLIYTLNKLLTIGKQSKYEMPIQFENIYIRDLLQQLIVPLLDSDQRHQGISFNFYQQGSEKILLPTNDEHNPYGILSNDCFVSDKRMLKFILLTLINNSINSINTSSIYESGEIIIDLEIISKGDFSVLKILLSDNGTKIPTEDINKYFRNEEINQRLMDSDSNNQVNLDFKICNRLLELYYYNFFTEIREHALQSDSLNLIENAKINMTNTFQLLIPIKHKKN